MLKKLFLLALLLLPVDSFAAISFVNKVTAGSTTGNNVTTGSVNMTGANLFVAVVSYIAPNAPSQVEDSVNGTTGWTKHDDEFLSGSSGVQIWSVDSVTGASQTFTVTSSGGLPAVVVYGFSGAHASAFESPTNNNSQASATTIDTGSITPDEDNELVVVGEANLVDTGVTINGGFTGASAGVPDEVGAVGGQHAGVAAAYLIQTTATAANPTFTNPGATDSATIITNYKAAAGGGGSGGRPLLLRLGL